MALGEEDSGQLDAAAKRRSSGWSHVRWRWKRVPYTRMIAPDLLRKEWRCWMVRNLMEPVSHKGCKFFALHAVEGGSPGNCRAQPTPQATGAH